MKKIYIKPEIDIIAEETDNILSNSGISLGAGYRPDIGQAKTSDWELSDPFEESESSESSEIWDH